MLDMFEVELALSNNEVRIYGNTQDCLAAILGARFNNEPLPHDVLVVDLDQIDCAEMLRKLRQIITPKELPCIIISGREIIELVLLDNRRRVKGLRSRWYPHVKSYARESCRGR